MRIVGGKWGGRRIEAPEGTEVTRPTTERTRESLASMVLSAANLDLSGERVLDAFAGSGAMGLELLSRGATYCTFVDSNRGAAARVRRNCRSLEVPTQTWRVVCGDVLRLAARPLAGGPFSVVFLDPPYALDAGAVSRMVEVLREVGNLTPNALVVYERSAERPVLELTAAQTLKSKRIGKTGVDLLRLTPTNEREAGK